MTDFTNDTSPSAPPQSASTQGAVVNIHELRKGPKKSILKDLYAYWESLRAGRAMPLRSEIDPREIMGVLESGFMLERLQPGAVRFRLAGMQLCDLMGMEVRGMMLRSFIAPQDRARFSNSLERVFSTPEVQEYTLVSFDSNHRPLHAQMLILPLKSDSGAIDRAIGCLVTEGVIGLAPRRFEMVNYTRTRLSTAHSAQPSRHPSSKADSGIDCAGFSEHHRPFTHAPRPQEATHEAKGDTQDASSHKKTPFLRLVVSN